MRIVQLTDLHILATPAEKFAGIDSFQVFERSLASALEQEPELIIVSGDLAEDGKVVTYQRIHDLLSSTGIPTFVLPGNHDSVDSMIKLFHQGPVRYEYLYEADKWNFVFLNSQVVGASYGEVDEQACEKLRKSLLAHPQKQFLIALHHTPAPPCSSPGCQLLGAEGMLQMLNEHENARIVIAGHVHQPAHNEVGHLAILTTPATSAQVDHLSSPKPNAPNDFWASHEVDSSRHGYRVIDLEDDGSFATEVHWLD